MTDAINPRQFASLDYADADMYGALLERPAPAVPLAKPLPVREANRQNASEIASEKRLWQEETARHTEYLRQQKQAEIAREAEITRREQAQRQAIANRIKGTDVPELQPPRPESPLAQLQRSTPERQPLPSTGSPPPKISGTAARADSLVEPTATPRPAAVREAIGSAVGGIGQTLPKSLPQAAGRLAVPGIGAGLTFAGALIAGQSVQQAATSAVLVTAGSYAGGIVGASVGGPIGFYVGSMIGGFVGGQLAGAFFPAPMPSGASHLTSYAPNYPPFQGGQGVGTLYQIEAQWSTTFNGNPGDEQSANIQVYGAIESIGLANYPGVGAPGIDIIAKDVNGNSQVYHQGSGFYGGTVPYNLRNIRITRLGGAPDTPINIQVPTPPPDNSPYQYLASPVARDNTVPSGTPAAGLNKGKESPIAPSMPSNNTPNGAPYFPGHGGLAPSFLPNPTQQNEGLPGLMPMMQPATQPLPFAEPDDVPVPRAFTALPYSPAVGGGSSGEQLPFPEEWTAAKAAFDASGNVIGTWDGKANPMSLPSSTAKPIAGTPTSDALSPVPKANTSPVAKTPEQVATDKQQQEFKDQLGQLTAIATAIAALTPAIQGLPDAIAKSPTVQAANKETTQGAVCEISQPTGCLGAPIKQAEDAAKANGTKLDEINAALGAGNAGANAALLAGQQTILQRLGDQLPGGIGGKLSRFADWMHLDRVLNIMILAATFHNALMLSNDIGQTFVGIINNVLQLIGLKKEDGSAFDIGSVISGSIENLIKGAIGADNYIELKESWAKANRIYQATNNVINSFLNLSQTILQASELIASYTGKIGNALKKGGVILESAYGWMNPQPKFNRVTQTLESLQNGASTIQMVTQAPLDVVNAVTESTTAATEFVKAVKEDDKPVNNAAPIPEPDELKAKETQSKTDSQPLSFDFSDLFDGED